METKTTLLAAYWKNRKITAREYIELCYTFLRKLQSFSPAFENRCVMIGTETLILPSDYPSFERILAEVINDKDYLYENPDPKNKTFTLDSSMSGGFSAPFSDPDPEATDATAISIRVAAGAYGGKYSPTNVVLIEVPATSDLLAGDLEKVKQLLKLVVEHWQPSFAVLTSSQLRRSLDPARKNSFTVGPLTYFADSRVKTLADGTAVSENGPDKGVLLTIKAPTPWTAAVDVFRPCYDRLSAAEALKWS